MAIIGNIPYFQTNPYVMICFGIHQWMDNGWMAKVARDNGWRWFLQKGLEDILCPLVD
jgi:hypothetical protein